MTSSVDDNDQIVDVCKINRSCLFSVSISAFDKIIVLSVWAKYCGRHLTTVVIHYSSKEGIERKVVVCSAYFPSDAKEASLHHEVKDLIGDSKAWT